jgi:hypothetical protein
VAQFGSALRSGRRGRRFKSGHPDAGQRPFSGLYDTGLKARLGAVWEPILFAASGRLFVFWFLGAVWEPAGALVPGLPGAFALARRLLEQGVEDRDRECEALLAAERPEAVISWLQPSRPGYKILARLASGELDLSHAALDAVADLHGNATGHIAALLTALGALPPRDTHMACLERDIAAILDGAAD